MQDIVTITRFSNPKVTKNQVLIAGTTTVDPNTGKMAERVTIFDTTGGAMKELGQPEVDKLSGAWPKNGTPFSAAASVRSILVRSTGNGQTTAAAYIPEGVPATAQAAQDAAAVTPAAKRRRTQRAQRAQRADELALFNAAPKRAEVLVEAFVEKGEAAVAPQRGAARGRQHHSAAAG